MRALSLVFARLFSLSLLAAPTGLGPGIKYVRAGYGVVLGLTVNEFSNAVRVE